MKREELKKQRRIRRKRIIRKKIFGTVERPRLVIFRSNKHMSAQIVNDNAGKTLVFVASFSKEMNNTILNMKKTDVSEAIGKMIAKKAQKKDIKSVVFDRNGYLFHGRVKAFADAARKSGLDF